MASHACDTKDSINGTALQSCSTGYSNGITELVKTDGEWQLLVGGLEVGRSFEWPIFEGSQPYLPSTVTASWKVQLRMEPPAKKARPAAGSAAATTAATTTATDEVPMLMPTPKASPNKIVRVAGTSEQQDSEALCK